MDRSNQQPSQRIQDRPMSHSAASQHQPPPPFPPFNHAPTAQPPIQIPFSDPFQNRDPFMPSSAHSRRGSYGIAPGQGSGGPPSYGERAWSAQPAAQQPPSQAHNSQNPPPPPPPPTAHGSMNPSNHMAYSYESARRRSVGGAGSPRRYAAGPLDALPPPPPPPSFASRTMPPPSPTTTAPPNSSFPVPAPRPPPAASPFAAPRDLSGFASRSGPSMSISSLIGGDSSRHGNHSPRTTATAPSPTIRPMHPPSPQRARSASIRTEQQYARPQSPANNPYAPRTHEPRGPPLPPNHARPPPEHPQSVPPQGPPPFAQSNLGAFRPFQSNLGAFRPFQSSPSSMHGDDSGRHSAHAPPRPNSQPMQPPPQEQEQRHRHEGYDPVTHHPGFRHFTEHMGRSSATSQPSSQPHPNDRTEGPHEPGLNGHSGPPPQHRMSPRLSQTARSTPAPNGQSMGRNNFNPPYREDQHAAALFRPSFNPYSQPPPLPQAPNGHREDLDYRGPRTEIFGRPIGEHRQSPTPSELARFDTAYRGPPAHYGPYGPHPYDGHANEQQHHRREDELHHRSLLGVSAEMARKNGRSSPLPQAVQGAQLRHVGPAADPSIKSEFGRMFPGLGLGVGSNTPIAGMSANGSATPSRMSPARQLERHETPSADIDGASNGSRGNKRSRKAKEDHPKDDVDGNEATSTPNMGHQSSKKAKTAHPPPHHHHHHAHHHHHHHHNLAEEAASTGPSPFNTLRFPPNPTVPQPPPAAHHHHHHHAVHAHAPHHHHHTQKPLPAPRQPEVTVSNQALLSSISHRPRKHLGSELYATKLGLPPRDSTPLDAKFHFRSRMKLLPRFEGKENCTFTIRVPRAYLASISTPEDEQSAIAGGLEEICRTRAIWGTEVYTDDSDVIAAAVHSGWLCGDFGEYNEDIHELFGEEFADQTNASLGKIICEKPKTPVRPVPNSDLHVTVLVAPPLTSYAATTQHHLRSREWGSDHDGMSIMIHSIQFVNEGKTNRFTDRGGAAKHQRIADDLKRREEAAESLLGLLKGGSSVSVGA